MHDGTDFHRGGAEDQCHGGGDKPDPSDTPLESKSVTDFQKACEILGFSGELTGTFGGSDNNSFAKNGIEGLVLSNGMYNAHSTREYTTVDDLYKGAELIGQLILL